MIREAVRVVRDRNEDRDDKYKFVYKDLSASCQMVAQIAAENAGGEPSCAPIPASQNGVASVQGRTIMQRPKGSARRQERQPEELPTEFAAGGGKSSARTRSDRAQVVQYADYDYNEECYEQAYWDDLED